MINPVEIVTITVKFPLIKKEDNMLDQLCIYLDDLAAKEKESYWSPFELKEQLLEVYSLFYGVFNISLNDVKKLYFERKIRSVKSKIEEFPETKLVGNLETGDVVVFSGCKGIYTIKSNEYIGSGENRLFFEGVPKSSVYGETIEVTLISKQKTKPKIKRVSELEIGDEVMRLIGETYQEITIFNIVNLNDNDKFVVCFFDDDQYQIQIYSGSAVFYLSDS